MAAAVLIVNVIVGGVRVALGPSARDRIAGVALLSTTGVGALLLIAELVDVPALRTAGLVLVALALVVVAVLVAAQEHHGRTGEGR
ncbi:hypothetical protein KXD98_02520 [Mycobacterium sp. SMC-4]|nr:hypothetical protein KXD98_02520 [Mycobacterium sp. SMC-4]